MAKGTKSKQISVIHPIMETLQVYIELNGILPPPYQLDVELHRELLTQISDLQDTFMATRQLINFMMQTISQFNLHKNSNMDEMVFEYYRVKDDGDIVPQQVSDSADTEGMPRADELKVPIMTEEWFQEVRHTHIELLEGFSKKIKSMTDITNPIIEKGKDTAKDLAIMMQKFPELENVYVGLYGKKAISYRMIKQHFSKKIKSESRPR